MRLVIFSLLFGCSCLQNKLVPAIVCGDKCYTATSGSPGMGPCKSGTWYCSSDKPPECLGEVGPSEELCDNLDNDCDGRVDEPLWHYCSSACGQGTETCYMGAWTACTAPLPTVEVCDGKDNDCDGNVDEIEDLPIEYCYSGPSGSVLLGECRPGVNRCINGRKRCSGDITPEPELCDGRDNDCDGRIDEGLASNRVDFVFVVDNSGSMTGAISAVKAASSAFASSYAGQTDVRWALFGAPDNDPTHDGKVHVISYFADVATFNTYMQLQEATGGGREPTLDAIVLLARTDNPLGLDWTQGASRHIVLFSDEDPQSYLNPPMTMWDSLSAILLAPDVWVHVFTAQQFARDYSALGPASRVSVKFLSDDPNVMQRELNSVVSAATCGH